jgi:cytochrome c oxidase assembly protein subunit 15|tara:strand:+ start:2137 stop:3171 length:1035 start_codon:yes stop_codon:yes gene_type:complete
MRNWLRACNIPLLLGVMALAVILAGGFARINDAGESCPDWPTCFGTLGFDVSEEDQTAWYESTGEYDSRGENYRYTSFEIFTEWFHRLLATGSGAVVLVGLYKVYKNREKLSDENWFAAKTALIIVLAQGGIGAITVFFDNHSWSVVLHLIFALIYTIWLFYWWLIWLRDVGEFPKWATLSSTISSKEKKNFGIFTLGTLPVLLLGVWVATGDGGAFNTGCSVGWWQGWPLCQGSLIPDIMGNIAVFVAWIHRVAVLVVGIWLMKGYFDLKNRLNGEGKNLQLAFGIAVLAFTLNILIGASYVILAAGEGFPELLSLAHLSFGTDVVLLLGLGYTICHLNETAD